MTALSSWQLRTMGDAQALMPRSELHDLPPAVHGAVDLEELQRLGLDPATVLDFSANTNPYGPSPAVRTALANLALDAYPDRRCGALTAALAQTHGVEPARILPGNGVSELIWLTALAYVQPGDDVLIIGPTYGEYARAAKLMGGRVTTLLARGEAAFAPDLVEIDSSLKSLRPRLVFICNPNNPTGVALPPREIAIWARQYRRTLFVVDEAYHPFVAQPGSAASFQADNILVLRSMTKDCGLAGLRLGYAIGPENVIESLRRAQPPWSVNTVAQAAGLAALGDPGHQRQSLKRIALAKQELTVRLLQLGMTVLPSATHFFLMRVGSGAHFRAVMLEHGMIVRDCASFGLPAYVRIAARRPDENQRFLAAVQEEI